MVNENPACGDACGWYLYLLISLGYLVNMLQLFVFLSFLGMVMCANEF